MKFVSSLSPEIVISLQEAYKNHPKHRARQRAQAFLLSSKGYSITQLSELFQVGKDTVGIWIRQWEQAGIVGLQDRSRSGCPLSLNEEEVALFRSYIDENPHQLKGAISQFEEKTGKKLSLDTYKRVLKKRLSLEKM